MPPRLALAAVLLLAASAVADDRSDAVSKQKEAAVANLKAANLKAAHAETDDLLVYATVPEAKAKPMAAAMQKTFDLAVKALKVEAKDKLWPGKLTAYVFTDPRQYRGYVLQVLKRSPVKGEAFVLDVRADPPFVLDGMDPGRPPGDAQVTMDAAALAAAGVLTKQVGTGVEFIPAWLEVGFGRAAYLQGNASRLANHRAKVKALYARTRGEAFKLSWLTEGTAGADMDLLATSFAEFLAFGPGAAKFPAVVAGFKPSDGNAMPTVQSALAAAEWKPEAVDAAWRNWVATGK